MPNSRHAIAALLLAALPTPLSAQNYDPPAAKEPDAETLRTIGEQTGKLRAAVADLAKTQHSEPQISGVEVYAKAAEWIVRHKEFYQPDSGKWTLAVLERGLQRAEQARQGQYPWLDAKNQTAARGYRSKVEGSVQPYAVTYPAGYGKDPKQKWRVDVELHGRDASLTEVKFLYQHAGGKDAPQEQDYVRIEIYGRGNNAYRWAGETDVLEVIDHFLKVEKEQGRGDLPDPRRVVMRGFSMGGAGSWHLGLHMPDRWCVIGPGAGFTTTHGYIKGLPDPLPEYQEACLRIYDAVDYSENAAEVPTVAYGGSKDPQLQAAKNVEARLKPLNIPMTLIVAPDLEHKFPPEWQKVAHAEYAKYAGEGKGRAEFPEHVRFVTYTLKYPKCEWVNIQMLERHYVQASVDATWKGGSLTATTANVREVRFAPPKSAKAILTEVTLDGQKLTAGEALFGVGWLFAKQNGKWSFVKEQRAAQDVPRFTPKRPGRQGPIDDAFTSGFVCVVGTGMPWHEATGRYANAEVERFRREWDKYMRGDLVVKKDTEVTPDDLRDRNLILFGDPSSNTIIKEVLSALPLTWDKTEIKFVGKSYDASTHIPALIYPNPIDGKGYVVLNSGHTFHAAEFNGTNAQLYPRLGDFAILKPTPTEKNPNAAEVVTAGLFDEEWKVQAK
jgi:hypothetical protein